MGRRRAVPVLVLLLGLLAGCGSSSGSDTAASGGEDSSSASGTPAATPTATSSTASPTASPTAPAFPRSRVQSGNLHVAVLDSSAARSSDEQAVVDAWMLFWQGAADTQYYYRATPGFLQVARGSARTDVLGYLARTKAKHERVVGWSRDNVTSVLVDGGRAKVRDCVQNYTFTVDHEGEATTRPAPYLAVTGRLQKTHGRWTVVSQTTKQLTRDCRA